MDYNPEDLRVDTFNAHEQGGFVHTNHTAVRITHLPTGAYVESKTERSLHRNKQRCMDLLPEAIKAKTAQATGNRAEELIACLEAEIVKRDARVAELSDAYAKELNMLAERNYQLRMKALPSAGVVLPELERWSVGWGGGSEVVEEAHPAGEYVRWEDYKALRSSLNPCRAQSVPDVLFDGFAVYSAIDAKAQGRTSPENVSDTLDAAVRLIRAAAPSANHAEQHLDMVPADQQKESGQ